MRTHENERPLTPGVDDRDSFSSREPAFLSRRLFENY